MNDPTSLTIWDEKVNQIYEIFGKPQDLNKTEFELFCQMGKSLGLNPFLREIWATKFGNQTSIFIGRDGYRKNAVSHPNYQGHFVDSIYSKDTFSVKGGVPEHSYGIGDRGEITGAYCLVYVKNNKIPIYVRVNFSEYDKGVKPGETNRWGKPKSPNTWNTMPETMIKKVAESQALRMAFPDRFNGTYDESENWTDSKPIKAEYEDVTKQPKPEAPKLETAKNQKPQPEPQPLPKPPKQDDSARKTWKMSIYSLIEKNDKKFGDSDSLAMIDKLQSDITDAEIAKIEKYVYSVIYDLQTKREELQKAVAYMGKYWDAVHINNSMKKHLGTDDIFQVDDIPAIIKYQDHLRGEYLKNQKGA